MKFALLVLCLVGVLSHMVYGQATNASCTAGTIWSQLGANDAERLTAVTFVTNRAFGLLLGNECLGHHFATAPSNLGSVFIAFLATVFGGNINNTNDNVTGIPYRIRGLTSNPIIPSQNLAGLLSALDQIHQPLDFSTQEQTAFKGAVLAVLASAKLPQCLINSISTILDATDPVVIGNSGTLSRPCLTATSRINWQNPTTGSASITQDQQVCFDWNDGLAHTVNDTNTPSLGLGGFGANDGANAVTESAPNTCNARGATASPCYLPPGFSYCIRFRNTGTFTFNCGIHGSGMTATVTVAAPTTTGTSTTGSGATTGGTTTGGSAGSSLRPSFIF